MRPLGLKSKGAHGALGSGAWLRTVAWNRLVTYQPPRLESQLLWGLPVVVGHKCSNFASALAFRRPRRPNVPGLLVGGWCQVG